MLLRWIVTTLVVLSVGRVLEARLTAQEGSGIIRRLTEATRDDAIACARAGVACAIAPYEVCPADNRRITAWIATPFSRVASGVFDALQARRRLNPMSPGLANRWGVGIYVFPAEKSPSAAAIQRVEIRRDGVVTHPLTSTVSPITVTADDNSRRVLSRGFFEFAVDVFDPSDDIDVVFVTTSGETRCLVDRARLSVLR